MLRFLHWMATGLRYFLITGPDGSPYLLRLLLRGRLPGDTEKRGVKWSLYFHNFLAHDRDRDLHNHPWTWSYSLVLWGGYVEEKRGRDGIVRRRRVWPGMINRLGPMDFHRIAELKGRETWTLFLAGTKATAWFFLVDGFLERSKAYLKAKGHKVSDEPEGPIPDWVLTCGICGKLFPPPARYHVRTTDEAIARGIAGAPVCHVCGAIPIEGDGHHQGEGWAPSPREEVTHG